MEGPMGILNLEKKKLAYSNQIEQMQTTVVFRIFNKNHISCPLKQEKRVSS